MNARQCLDRLAVVRQDLDGIDRAITPDQPDLVAIEPRLAAALAQLGLALDELATTVEPPVEPWITHDPAGTPLVPAAGDPTVTTTTTTTTQVVQ